MKGPTSFTSYICMAIAALATSTLAAEKGVFTTPVEVGDSICTNGYLMAITAFETGARPQTYGVSTLITDIKYPMHILQDLGFGFVFGPGWEIIYDTRELLNFARGTTTEQGLKVEATGTVISVDPPVLEITEIEEFTSTNIKCTTFVESPAEEPASEPATDSEPATSGPNGWYPKYDNDGNPMSDPASDPVAEPAIEPCNSGPDGLCSKITSAPETPKPTLPPTPEPTEFPSPSPTEAPTAFPSGSPSAEPSAAPSATPTEGPPGFFETGNFTEGMDLCSEYQETFQVPDLPVTINYVVNLDYDGNGTGTFAAQVIYEGEGWVGFAISPSGGMVGSTAIIGLPEEEDTNPGKYFLGARNLEFVSLVENQTLIESSIEQNETHTIMSFVKLLEEEGEPSIDPFGNNTFLVAFGWFNDLAYHQNRASFQLALTPCYVPGYNMTDFNGTMAPTEWDGIIGVTGDLEAEDEIDIAFSRLSNGASGASSFTKLSLLTFLSAGLALLR